jgi:hypothetical protein
LFGGGWLFAFAVFSMMVELMSYMNVLRNQEKNGPPILELFQ